MEKSNLKKSRELTGQVVSVRMKDTVIVAVDILKKHPIYRKVIHRTHRFKADSRGFELVAGDSVKIAEIKPMSKTKHFRVTEKTKK
jgi:small subunit ribosomal protein S17